MVIDLHFELGHVSSVTVAQKEKTLLFFNIVIKIIFTDFLKLSYGLRVHHPFLPPVQAIQQIQVL